MWWGEGDLVGHLHAELRQRIDRMADLGFDQTAQLWSEAGTLLATTHQVVYFKG